MSIPIISGLDGPTVGLLAMRQAEPCMLCKVYQWLMGGVTMVWIYLWSRYIYSLDISNTGCRLCLMPVASLRSAHCELLRLICSIDTFSGHSNWQWPVMVTVPVIGPQPVTWSQCSLLPHHRTSITSTITHHTMFRYHLLHFECVLPRYEVGRYKPNTV